MPTTITRFNRATPRQLDTIAGMARDRALEPDAAARLSQRLDAGDLDFTTASATITWLSRQPRVQRASATRSTSGSPLPAVPAGHYAVASATGNNDLDFYRVDCPTEGRWAGRTFVKRVIGGRPAQAIRGAEQADAILRIASAGITDSAVLYGQQIGRCYRCNRHLTDETSRALGIGPDCRGR